MDGLTKEVTGTGSPARFHAVHLTSAHPADDTRIFHKECRTLVEAGFRVTLVNAMGVRGRRNGVDLRSVSKPSGRLERMTYTAAKVVCLGLSLKPDIIHIHDSELLPWARLLLTRGHRVIYDIHEDLRADLPTRHYLKGGIGRPVASAIGRLEDAVIRSATGVVAATPLLARKARNLNAAAILVNNYPLPGELTQSSRPWRDRSDAVSYVGSIARERGLFEMVDAMARFPPETACKLRLVGRVSQASEAAEAARRPGWERVVSMGQLDRQGVGEVLGDSKAGLVVFHPKANHVESQPNKLFEYMAAGVPVIASGFDAWSEIITPAECGLLVDPMNVNEIAAAIQWILAHPEESERMGENGRRAVNEQYGWASEGRKLCALYQRIVPPLPHP